MASTPNLTQKPPAAAPTSQHVDEVIEGKSQNAVHWDEEVQRQERRLIRKLDLTLMPMVWILYLFIYLDRNNIAQAKLNTFEEDLNLHGSQYSTAIYR
ncbi:hypothetical protein BDW74DRAFT_173734 [Aspergillus multicolor]|uniref:uncharacterized protein n=1 Tax=Aspergillus multicolor TaxID=41759 RepID=UPI003CCE0DD6